MDPGKGDGVKPGRTNHLQKGSYYVDIAAMAVLILAALVILYMWS
jgi:hypothetical protein